MSSRTTCSGTGRRVDDAGEEDRCRAPASIGSGGRTTPAGDTVTRVTSEGVAHVTRWANGDVVQWLRQAHEERAHAEATLRDRLLPLDLDCDQDADGEGGDESTDQPCVTTDTALTIPNRSGVYVFDSVDATPEGEVQVTFARVGGVPVVRHTYAASTLAEAVDRGQVRLHPNASAAHNP